ncbi:MAG: AAA family ATPase, partial [Candidatus Acidiferrum sp.]
MSQQMSTDAGIECATNSPNTIRVDEQQLLDSTVFTVYRHHRCYKRLAPTKGDGAAQWFEQDASGNRSLVSKPKAKRLDRIWKRRDSYPRVRRYPRRNAKGERLLPDLANSHASGQTEGDPGSALTWNALPRFDPTQVKKSKWLINSLLAEGSIQLVFGERGSFKSTFFLAAAKAIANAEEFLGMKTRQRRVLYLDFENPADVIKARNDDLGVGLPGIKNLVVWDRFGTLSAPRPGDPLLEAIVKNCIAETGHAPWIIFDSWASLLKPGEGGEFTGQIAPIYLHLRKLADLGAAVTVIDHTKKNDPETLYGGQDKEAKADSIHKLLTFPNKMRPNNPIIRVESWLKRYAPQGEGSFAFEVQGEQDSKGNWHIVGLVPAQDPEETKSKEQIALLRNLIRQNPNSGKYELAS